MVSWFAQKNWTLSNASSLYVWTDVWGTPSFDQYNRSRCRSSPMRSRGCGWRDYNHCQILQHAGLCRLLSQKIEINRGNPGSRSKRLKPETQEELEPACPGDEKSAMWWCREILKSLSVSTAGASPIGEINKSKILAEIQRKVRHPLPMNKIPLFKKLSQQNQRAAKKMALTSKMGSPVVTKADTSGKKTICWISDGASDLLDLLAWNPKEICDNHRKPAQPQPRLLHFESAAGEEPRDLLLEPGPLVRIPGEESPPTQSRR